MRVLVCGGREFTDRALVFRVLSRLNPAEICHGAARGADTLAAEWADTYDVPAAPYPVYKKDWDQYGKSAGHRRNQQMLDDFQPDGVVAFSGGRGTADMVSKATWARVPVICVNGYNGAAHNWIEDYFHENGNYMNRCITCERAFMGHKRRVSCWECAHAVD